MQARIINRSSSPLRWVALGAALVGLFAIPGTAGADVTAGPPGVTVYFTVGGSPDAGMSEIIGPRNTKVTIAPYANGNTIVDCHLTLSSTSLGKFWDDKKCQAQGTTYTIRGPVGTADQIIVQASGHSIDYYGVTYPWSTRFFVPVGTSPY